MTAALAAPPGSLSASGLRRVLAVLCVTEITSWGILYYAFPVLAPDISRTMGWPTTWVMAAFSGGQVVAALAGIPVGRWLDRRGPHAVMTALGGLPRAGRRDRRGRGARPRRHTTTSGSTS